MRHSMQNLMISIEACLEDRLTVLAEKVYGLSLTRIEVKHRLLLLGKMSVSSHIVVANFNTTKT